MATAGDRRDEDIRELGTVASNYFDHIIVREDEVLGVIEDAAKKGKA